MWSGDRHTFAKAALDASVNRVTKAVPKVIPDYKLVPSGAVDCERNANQAGIDDDLAEIMDHRVALGAVIAAKIAIAGIAFG
jgi:hypothetical protein